VIVEKVLNFFWVVGDGGRSGYGLYSDYESC
jgi:hypothetical protein